MPEHPELAEAAAALVAARAGARVVLRDAQILKDRERNVVVRFRVDGASEVGSVIVKWMKERESLGFDDWASLAYLSATAGAAGLVPRFYGGDAAARLFVMQDLGGSRSLDDVLRVGDREAAVRTLALVAAQYGRLHAATLGDAGRYERLRATLPGAPRGRHGEAEAWLTARPALQRWLDALGVTPPPGFDAALERVAATYAEPGPFLAFTHGDPAPTNTHIAASAAADPDVRLLDFEYGGFRHALYDVTAWEVLCPLPTPAVRAMADRYRAVLAPACPAAADDELWRVGWVAMCAYRAIAMLTWLPTAALDADRPWVESWTVRQAALATVARLRGAAAPVAALAPLGDAAALIEDALRSRWRDAGEGDAVLPRWAAFDDEGHEGRGFRV
jgi:hypothetical protein